MHVITYANENDESSKESHGPASMLTTADIFTVTAGHMPALHFLHSRQNPFPTQGTPAPSDTDSQTTRSQSLGMTDTLRAPSATPSQESSAVRDFDNSPRSPLVQLSATIAPSSIQQPTAVRRATLGELRNGGPVTTLIDKHYGSAFWKSRSSIDAILPRIRSIKEYYAIPANRYLYDPTGLRYAQVWEQGLYEALLLEIDSEKTADTRNNHFNDYERGMRLKADSPTLKKIFRGDQIHFPLQPWRKDGGRGVPVADYRLLLNLIERGGSDPVEPQAAVTM